MILNPEKLPVNEDAAKTVAALLKGLIKIRTDANGINDNKSEENDTVGKEAESNRTSGILSNRRRSFLRQNSNAIRIGSPAAFTRTRASAARRLKNATRSMK